VEYSEFLESKKHKASMGGFDPVFMPQGCFDFQSSIIEKCLNNGRYAGFIDTGLGKTLIQLTIAQNCVIKTGERVLIITPLAVAYQFIQEAEKFGICEPKYSKDGSISSDVVICNYERLDKFNPRDFGTVILDESSILKNFDGKIKNQVTSFLKKVDYRFLFTATPSPNDFIELGTSSEALGYLGYTDMLGRFFTNNEDTIKPVNMGAKWVLKGHAEKSFYDWVSSWSMSVRKPSDLGFSDELHVLPELIVNPVEVDNREILSYDGQMEMFSKPSSRLTEVRQEQKQTITERCEEAAKRGDHSEPTVFWCNFNDEASKLSEIVEGSYEIKGSMNIDKKEEMLIAFQKGEIKKLITKPKITCFGLNWQHCNHTVYFPTFSYEQYYQAIRRFWRFGQKKPVNVDLIYSNGQAKVIQSLMEKAKKADQLFTMLNKELNSFDNTEVNKFIKQTNIPGFLK
jgi:superfamily II DNA or RNA helicase